MKRAAPLVAAAAILAACGGGGRTAATTVQHYSDFPPDTIVVSSSDPTSPACRRDATALGREAVTFIAAHHTTFNIADATYFTLREADADFDARRCEPKLLGTALARALSPARRRELLRDLPRAMAARFRAAIAAAGT